MAHVPSEEPLPWLSVSDLAEYAYCPRAQWYRHHPPDGPTSAASERSAAAGADFTGGD